MAKLIKYSGQVTNVYPKDKDTGFTLSELYELINCDMIEVKQLEDGSWMIIDEEAKLKKNWVDRINHRASDLYEKSYNTTDVIAGNAVICNDEEFQ